MKAMTTCKKEEKDDATIMTELGQPELLNAKKIVNLETGASTAMRLHSSVKPLNNAATTTTAFQPSHQNIPGLNDGRNGVVSSHLHVD